MSAPASVAADSSRARRWFWVLVLVAVLAMGALYRALAAPPSATVGLQVLVAGLVLAVAAVQATRIVRALKAPLSPRRS